MYDLLPQYLHIIIGTCPGLMISIGNHTHSSPIREIIVLAIVKIGGGEAKSNFNYCVYNYSLIGRECV